ncbi:hypothetical protein OSTOST_21195 [Ostertagia ostertagi]
MVICAEEVEKARQRFAGRIHRTPVITCQSIDNVAGMACYSESLDKHSFLGSLTLKSDP